MADSSKFNSDFWLGTITVAPLLFLTITVGIGNGLRRIYQIGFERGSNQRTTSLLEFVLVVILYVTAVTASITSVLTSTLAILALASGTDSQDEVNVVAGAVIVSLCCAFVSVILGRMLPNVDK